MSQCHCLSKKISKPLTVIELIVSFYMPWRELEFFYCCLFTLHTVGIDFNSLVDPELVLTPVNSEEPVCLSVNLINDGISEERETFLIAMSTLRERVELDSPTQVTISDNDS